LFFTYFFINSSKELDAPVEANLEANTSQIKKIEQLVQKTEEAVKIRKGELPSSQNESSIVQ
jgi:hypothetical protein